MIQVLDQFVRYAVYLFGPFFISTFFAAMIVGRLLEGMLTPPQEFMAILIIVFVVPMTWIYYFIDDEEDRHFKRNLMIMYPLLFLLIITLNYTTESVLPSP